MCVRIRGEQSPTSHGLGCLGQVLYTRDQPRAAFAAHGGYSIPHTHNKIKPFLRKNPKRLDFIRKKSKKVQNLTKSQQKGERQTARFFLRSSRFASLTSPRRKKTGGTLSNTPKLVESLLYLGNYRGAERVTVKARARAAATQRLSEVISWQLNKIRFLCNCAGHFCATRMGCHNSTHSTQLHKNTLAFCIIAKKARRARPPHRALGAVREISTKLPKFSARGEKLLS